MLLQKRKAARFQEEQDNQVIKKVQPNQAISIQQVLQDQSDRKVIQMMENLDRNELENFQDYRGFRQKLCEDIRASDFANYKIIQSLSQLLCCKLSDKHQFYAAKILLIEQLQALIHVMNPQDCLLVSDLIIKKEIKYDEQVVKLLYNLIQAAYNAENKQRVQQIFRLMDTKIQAGIGKNLDKLKFFSDIGLQAENMYQKQQDGFTQEILLIDSVLSKQLISQFFNQSFVFEKEQICSQIMTYKVELSVKNMKQFIKNLNKTFDSRVVEPITFWFLCQQANSLNKQISKVAFKGLSQIKYGDEDDLLSLIIKEKGTDGLFHVRESNWIKQENHWYSLTGLLIYALEDEFSDIRKYAIQCLKNFGIQNALFGKECRDMLFYMMNDENDEVRIQAINSLKEIYSPFHIDKSDLDIILFNLKERNLELRLALYGLISQSLTDSQQTLLTLIESISLNLQKFNEDFNFLCLTFRDFSVINTKIIQDNIPILLADRMNQEVDWFRQEHILKIIIIKNALNKSNIQELPFYFCKHVDYLMDKYPNYFIVKESSQFMDIELQAWIKQKDLQNYDLTHQKIKCLKYFKGQDVQQQKYLVNFIKLKSILSKFKIVDDLQLKLFYSKNMVGLLLLYQNQLNDLLFESHNFQRLVQLCYDQIKNFQQFDTAKLLLEQYMNNPKMYSKSAFRCYRFFNQMKQFLNSLDINIQLSVKDIHEKFMEKQFDIIKKQDKITFTNKYSTFFKLTALLKGIDLDKQHMIQIKYPEGQCEYHKICSVDVKPLDQQNSILETEILLRSVINITSFSIKICLVNDLNDSNFNLTTRDINECLPSNIIIHQRKIAKIPKVGSSQTIKIDFKIQQ